jgi:hypothetical protein
VSGQNPHDNSFNDNTTNNATLHPAAFISEAVRLNLLSVTRATAIGNRLAFTAATLLLTFLLSIGAEAQPTCFTLFDLKNPCGDDSLARQWQESAANFWKTVLSI